MPGKNSFHKSDIESAGVKHTRFAPSCSTATLHEIAFGPGSPLQNFAEASLD